MADVKDGELPLQKQLQGFFKAMEDNLEQKQKDQLQGLILEVETLGQKVGSAASKADLEPLQKRLTEIAGQATEMMGNMTKNQEVIDKFVSEYNKKQSSSTEKQPFQEGWSEMVKEIASKKDSINDMQKYKSAKMEFELKTSMTISTAVGAGNGVNAYNQQIGIVPRQKINFRDLIPTVSSDNGQFVTYRETNTVQAIGVQTENNAKANVLYAFTPGTATLKYIAGFATFTKQLLFSIPFLNQYLPPMLLRDFYKKENDYFYTTVAGNATGNNAAANPTPTIDVEEIIRMIANQEAANFSADIGVIDWAEWSRLLTTKPNDYSLPAGTVINNQGVVTIAGMPIVPASWSQTDHILLWDQGYVQRVEGESLRVEFSYENQDNFEKNLITARVECFEEINLLRADAIIYRDFANS